MSLDAFLDRAAKAYYEGNPIITDEQFDSLVELIGYDKVGASASGEEFTHTYPMWSLQKYYEDQKKVNPLAGVSTNITRTPKLDGAAVAHTYVEGNYVRSLTRGDGIRGRDVTAKFEATKLIPKTIDAKGVVQITGELVSPKTTPNARNYAAGALNLGSIDEFKTRAVTFFAYGVQPYVHEFFDDDMKWLNKQGFWTVQDMDIAKIYPTDGVVFRLNNNSLFEAQGYTAKHPRGAYALKERQECVETVLLDVTWQVGKSGKVTPVAILEPVQVGDATVSRATLNNPAFIEALDLQIGDTVGIRRSGEIIPQIVYKAAA